MRGLNAETQVWRHREGAGSQARIVVTTGMPQPFTIVPTPPHATVRFVAGTDEVYEPGMSLAAGEYRVEVSAPPRYESYTVTVSHGTTAPTRIVVELVPLREISAVFQAEASCRHPAVRESDDEDIRLQVIVQSRLDDPWDFWWRAHE